MSDIYILKISETIGQKLSLHVWHYYSANPHKETFRYLKFGTWQIDYVVEYSIRMPAIGKKAMLITCQHNCLKPVNLMKVHIVT